MYVTGDIESAWEGAPAATPDIISYLTYSVYMIEMSMPPPFISHIDRARLTKSLNSRHT